MPQLERRLEMKVVIFAEKPFLGHHFLGLLLETEPTVDRSSLVMAYANDIVHLNNAFTFPRGLPYSAFPMTREQMFKPLSFEWIKPRIGVKEGGVSSAWDQGYRRDPSWEREGSDVDVAEAVIQADRIYMVLDPNDSADYVAKRIEAWVDGLGTTADIFRPRFISFADGNMREELATTEKGAIRNINPASSVIRKHFDYNYLLNANVVLQATFQAALGRPMERVLAKNALQILFHLQDGRKIDDGKLIELMTKWQGTGRYTKAAHGYHNMGMGRASSRYEIIQHLVREGLLSRRSYPGRKVQPLQITADGLRLLDFLHPDCRDADQVCRIAIWMQLPLEEAKPKIDRYIRTFFGKQMRFLSKKITSEQFKEKL
jgi:hypothetical protein